MPPPPARSQSLNHLSATVSGLSTIRSCGRRQRTLAQEFDKLQDLHSSSWTLVLNTNRAFGFWMDMICCLYLAFVTFSFFLFATEGEFLYSVLAGKTEKTRRYQNSLSGPTLTLEYRPCLHTTRLNGNLMLIG